MLEHPAENVRALARGDPLAKHCCTVNVLLEVEWRSLRADYCLREARGTDGKDELRCWPEEY